MLNIKKNSININKIQICMTTKLTVSELEVSGNWVASEW